MKSVLTYDILKRVEYQNQNISYAAQTACDEMLARYGDDGGVVGLDKDGNVAHAFSSSQMSWAYQNNDMTVHYGLHVNEDREYNIENCKNKIDECLPAIPIPT
jgi:isoaspartyl peptidase/L-asparaginase-like protein (Ntn-hydrolase superfamily)